MTWSRTAAPEGDIEDIPEGEILEDDLPDERDMEPQEVVDLYKKAKRSVPAWVTAKMETIKRKEREDAGDEEPEEEIPEVADEAEAAETAQEPEFVEEEVEEVEPDGEAVDPEEILLKLPVGGVTEAQFTERRPHPDFRDHFAAEN